MTDRTSSAPRVPPEPEKQPEKPKERGGDVRHIVDTGLPPGISVDEAKDPGSQGPRGPTDDRS
jgi:hypothetical protein